MLTIGVVLIIAGILAGVLWRHDVGIALVVIGLILVVIDVLDTENADAITSTAAVFMRRGWLCLRA